MKYISKFLGIFGIALSVNAATIDTMYTAQLGQSWDYYYSSYQEFTVFPQAHYYLLDDGSTWEAGAGWHPDTISTVSTISVSGTTITYTFDALKNNILFQNTDYNSGDHSAQGVLGFSGPLKISTELGSTTAVLSGYTKVLSNNETSYGVPLFNYYSADTGDLVYFEVNYVLRDGAVFDENLFNTDFSYKTTAYVDFTNKATSTPPVTSFFVEIGDLYAVDDSSRTINHYASDSRFIDSFNLPDSYGFEIRGMSPGPGNLLYMVVVTDFGFRIVTLDQQENLTIIAEGTDYLEGSGFSGKISVSDSGHVYLAARDDLLVFEPGSKTGVVIYTDNQVQDVEILPNGNLLVITAYSLKEITPTGAVVRDIDTSIRLVDAVGVEYAPSTNKIYATMLGYSGQFHRLMKINFDTGNVEENVQFIYPIDMFFTTENTLIVGSWVQAPGIFNTDLALSSALGINEQIFVTQMTSFDADNNEKPFCDLPPVPTAGKCEGEVVARSEIDISDYINSDFGKTVDQSNIATYKNIRLLGDIGSANNPLTVTSPCRITVNANSSLTGSDISLQARQGLNLNWSADIDASGQVCLTSDKRHALLNGGNKINADSLAIRGHQKAFVGFQSTLNISGLVELESTGSGSDSHAKIGNKTVVTADDIKLSSDNIAELAFDASLISVNDIVISSGDLTTSEVSLANQSNLEAGRNIQLVGKNYTRVGFNSDLKAGDTLEISAKTMEHCSIANSASLAYAAVSGNCLNNLRP